MLTPPDGLETETMRRVLAQRWGLTITSIEYQPVGFGSHHWHVVDSTGAQWFVTVDELYTKRLTMADLDDDAFERLYAALATASDLRSSGASFVIAPQLTLDGHPLVRIASALGIALYRFVDGRSYTFHDMLTPAHRAELLQLLAQLHSVPLSTVAHAHVDDFWIPNRDALELMMQPGDQTVVVMELYRIRWDLADLAAYASRFAGEHVGNEDDRQSCANLAAVLAGLEA